MRTILTRAAALFRRRRLERELREEVACHLAMQEEEFRARGMSAAEARLAARREFGGVAQMQECYRERRGIPWLEIAAKDFRYVLRGLRRSPGFTAAAMISLALGIGANTAVFSLFYSLMMRNLPVARPSELATLRASGPTGQVSYPLYEEIARRTDLFRGVFVADDLSEESVFHRGRYYSTVSSNYFTVLGVKPVAGRFFNESDVRSGEKVVVLSYDYWQQRYGGAADAVGRRPSPGASLVIGVAPPGFRGVQRDRHPEYWVPLEYSGGYRFQREDPRIAWVSIMARLRPDVPRAKAQAALDVLVAQHTAQVFGDLPEPFRKQALARRVEVREGELGLSLVRDKFGRPLGVLMVAVAIVLLAACVNVAHLLLARGAARRREIAMRLSIGATRARLVRQSLMEALALGASGSVLGGLFSLWGRRYILHALPSTSGDPFGAPDRAVLAFAACIACLSVALFGLIPALRSTALDPASGLRGEGFSKGRRRSLRRGLVAAQVALSVLLVALASLFGRSLGQLQAAGARFGDRDVIAVGPIYYPQDQPSAAQRLRDAVLAIPGVAAISSGNLGLDGSTASSSVRVPGSARTEATPAPVDYRRVAPGFFATLGARVLQGREFNLADTSAKWDDLAIVNREFVKEFMPGERNPVGRTFQFAAVTLASRPEPKAIRIVGVVEDIPHKELRQRPEPTVYVPANLGAGTTLVATNIPAEAVLPALRRELQKSGAMAISEPQTVRSRIEDSIFQDRILASLSWFFGGLTLLLAGVGLYGVVAYETVRRSGEIGIRVALGAERSSILWLILRSALIPVLIGLAIGLPAALAAGRAVRSILFGIDPGDPVTFVSTACILAATGAAAALLPARRAAATDPMRALRSE